MNSLRTSRNIRIQFLKIAMKCLRIFIIQAQLLLSLKSKLLEEDLIFLEYLAEVGKHSVRVLKVLVEWVHKDSLLEEVTELEQE